MTQQTTQTSHTQDPRLQIIEAFMTVATHTHWREITLNTVAQEAQLPLHVLRAHFPSVGAILGGFARHIDMTVLRELAGEPDAFSPDESAKERLFDVFMRRFDALAPYKTALKKLVPALKYDPVTLIALNGAILNAHRYMLAAANISPSGCFAPMVEQGSALVFAKTLDVWLDDDDAGLARTMAHLDASLLKTEKMMHTLCSTSERMKPLTSMIANVFKKRDSTQAACN